MKNTKHIKVRVQTEARTERITEIKSDTYRIETRTEAQEGKANQRVREILAEFYDCDVANIRIVSGFQRPNKIVEVTIE